jgi:hypothetical protein
LRIAYRWNAQRWCATSRFLSARGWSRPNRPPAASGAALLDQAVPLWRQAQADVKSHLGGDEFFQTINALKKLSDL